MLFSCVLQPQYLNIGKKLLATIDTAACGVRLPTEIAFGQILQTTPWKDSLLFCAEARYIFSINPDPKVVEKIGTSFFATSGNNVA